MLTCGKVADRLEELATIIRMSGGEDKEFEGDVFEGEMIELRELAECNYDRWDV